MITIESLREQARYHIDTAKFHSDPGRMRFHVTAADTLDALADMLEKDTSVEIIEICLGWCDQDLGATHQAWSDLRSLQLQLAAVTAERDELKLQLENRE